MFLDNVPHTQGHVAWPVSRIVPSYWLKRLSDIAACLYQCFLKPRRNPTDLSYMSLFCVQLLERSRIFWTVPLFILYKCSTHADMYVEVGGSHVSCGQCRLDPSSLYQQQTVDTVVTHQQGALHVTVQSTCSLNSWNPKLSITHLMAFTSSGTQNSAELQEAV